MGCEQANECRDQRGKGAEQELSGIEGKGRKEPQDEMGMNKPSKSQ